MTPPKKRVSRDGKLKYALGVNTSFEHGFPKQAYDLERTNRSTPSVFVPRPAPHLPVGVTRAQSAAIFFNNMVDFLERHGRVVGQGAYGTVFLLKLESRLLGGNSPLLTIQTLPEFGVVSRGYEAWLRRLAREGGGAIVKIDQKSTFAEADREAAMHIEAYRCWSGAHVPRFGAAAYLKGARDTAAVTVMQAVEGAVTLQQYISKHQSIPRHMVLAIEKAVTDLWLCGVYHGDLHPGNIIVQEGGGGKVQIIDFGFTIKLPASKLGELEVAIARERSRPTPDYTAALRSVPLLREAITIRIGRKVIGWQRPHATTVSNNNMKYLASRTNKFWYNPDQQLLKLIRSIYADSRTSASPRRTASPVSSVKTSSVKTSASVASRRAARVAGRVHRRLMPTLKIKRGGVQKRKGGSGGDGKKRRVVKRRGGSRTASLHRSPMSIVAATVRSNPQTGARPMSISPAPSLRRKRKSSASPKPMSIDRPVRRLDAGGRLRT